MNSNKSVARIMIASSKSDGIEIRYFPKIRVLRFFGWYDEIVGLDEHRLGLREFLQNLGITIEDCKKALEGGDRLHGFIQS